MYDLNAGFLEVKALLETGIPEGKTIEKASEIDLDQLLARRVNTPAFFVVLVRKNAMAAAPGFRAQTMDLEVHVGIVTDGLPSTATAADGALGSDAMRNAAVRALHGGRLSNTMKPLDYDDENYAGAKNGRSLWEEVFVTRIHETFT